MNPSYSPATPAPPQASSTLINVEDILRRLADFYTDFADAHNTLVGSIPTRAGPTHLKDVSGGRLDEINDRLSHANNQLSDLNEMLTRLKERL